MELIINLQLFAEKKKTEQDGYTTLLHNPNEEPNYTTLLHNPNEEPEYELLSEGGSTTTPTTTQPPSTTVSAPTLGANPTLPTYDTSSYDDSTKGIESWTAYQDALGKVNSYGDFEYGNKAWLDSVMNAIKNGEKFSYDLNGDALYQQYKDKYIQQGKMAMGDAMGQAAAMTGGYGNSYAQSVGQQAYQAQLQNLNDIVPELYQMALDKYNMDRQDLYNQYSMLTDDYDRGYAQHQDGYNKLMDMVGITRGDYYDGADMFHTEQGIKNDAASKGFNDAMAILNRNDSNSWKTAEWNRDQVWRDEDIEYRDGRDAIEDERYEAETAEDTRRYEAETAEDTRRWEATFDATYGTDIKNEEWWNSYQEKNGPLSYSTLKYGSEGNEVIAVQQFLMSQGYEIEEYGIIGAETERAIKDYQAKNGLAADGIIGPNTWAVMMGGKPSSNNTTGGTDNTSDKNPTGGVSTSDIKQMQAIIGVGQDGKWGPKSTAAAGGLSVEEAYKAWKNGTLKKASTDYSNTANVKSFKSSLSPESAHDTIARQMYGPYTSYVAVQLAKNTKLSDDEKMYLISYYGITESDLKYARDKGYDI